MKNLVGLFFLLVATACGKFEGTNTGNPFSGDMASPILSTTTSLAYQVCTKINACYTSITYQTCYENIVTLSNYTSELGTISITYSSLTALNTAEANGSVTPNVTNADSCKAAVSALTCSDSLVQSAFNLSSPTDFSKTNYLFRASSNCTKIY